MSTPALLMIVHMLSPEVQNEFAQGNGGVFGANSPQSWGPKIAGQQVTDWTGKQTTLAAQPDNLKGFFRKCINFKQFYRHSAGEQISHKLIFLMLIFILKE